MGTSVTAVGRSAQVALWACATALAGCGAPEPAREPPPETTLPGPSSQWTQGVAVPWVSGAFTRVFQPAARRYLNDHTVALGDDGRWHLFGITHGSEGHPQEERSFLHASAASVGGPWREEGDILMAQGDEQVLWAPHVFRPNSSTWTMIFWGGTTEAGAPTVGLRMADSVDLSRWQRNGRRAPGGRDPYVMAHEGRWLLYSTGVSAQWNGQIVVSESADLERWSEPRAVLEDPVPNYPWGNLESPYVVRFADAFYLFVTRTGPGHLAYFRTLVFRSTDPRRFAWRPLTEIHAHAAEVFEHQRQWYITSAGWTSEVGEESRGLSLARLLWVVAE